MTPEEQVISWTSILRSHLEIRSLYRPTVLVSLKLWAGPSPSDVRVEVPYKEFEISDYFADIEIGKPWHWELELIGFDAMTLERRAVSYPIRWKAYRRTLLKPGVYRYFFYADLDKIFVIVALPSKPGDILPSPERPRPRDPMRLGPNLEKQVRRIAGIDLSRDPTAVFQRLKPLSTAPKGTWSPRNEVTSPILQYESVQDITVTNGSYSAGAPRPRLIFSREWASERTPGFKRLKKRERPVNVYALRIARIADGPTHLNTSAPGLQLDEYIATVDGSFIVTPSEPSLPAGARDWISRKLADRAQAGLTANWAETSVTIMKTVKLIGGIANVLANTFHLLKLAEAAPHKDLQKRYFDRATQLLFERVGTRPSNAWPNRPPSIPAPSQSLTVAQNVLAYQYGIKPLLKDIQDSMRIVADHVVKPPRTAVRATKHYSPKGRTEQLASTAGDFGNARPIDVNYIESCVVKGVVYYALNSRLVSYLSQIGFTNPISLGWELLPFSFVYDWFLPIGPYLETLSNWQGMVFQQGSFSYLLNQGVSVAHSDSKTSFGVDRSIEFAYNRRVTVFVREKLTTFPVAELPRFKNPLSFDHAINALALLRVKSGNSPLTRYGF